MPRNLYIRPLPHPVHEPRDYHGNPSVTEGDMHDVAQGYQRSHGHVLCYFGRPPVPAGGGPADVVPAMSAGSLLAKVMSALFVIFWVGGFMVALLMATTEWRPF